MKQIKNLHRDKSVLRVDRLFVFIFLAFMVQSVRGQQVRIAGDLKNGKGVPIGYASVVLKNSRDHIVGFTNANEQGRYVLAIPDTPQISSFAIEVNFLGFKKVRQQLLADRIEYDFILEEEAINLRAVEIKSRPHVVAKGDTLSYEVATFSRLEDRSIGDVIRRLPGVSVDESGKIAYNGKDIQNLYIHGDDLMDGRYGLATKIITKDMVKSVEVMQHFQPIKVLKNKVMSDGVAMNLVLKNENNINLGGQAMIGAGIANRFDASVNTMMFNARYKMLNVLQSNNSGVDYKNDFAQLGTGSSVNSISAAKPVTLLSLSPIGAPNIPKSNYFFNKSSLINANNLHNLKGGLQLKANIQVYLDRNTLAFQSQIDNYLKGDTIRYVELQSAINRPRELNTAFTATKNEETFFLNNKLSFSLREATNASYLDFNDNSFEQTLNESTRNFFNDFNYIPALKNKNIMDVRWYINYYNKPQNLDIGTGVNQKVLNNGNPFASVKQLANIPSISSNLSVSYRILNSSLIKQNYTVGIINEWQELNSRLRLTQLDGTVLEFTGDAGNDLAWTRTRLILNSEYYIKNEKWQASLSAPLIAQTIHYQQKAYNLNNTRNQFLITPNAMFKLFLSSEDYISANYGFSNSIGTIADVYRGTILVNYRSLRANNASLQERYASSSGLFYNFQRSVIMLFMNAGINYTKITANSILSSLLNEEIERTELLPFENDQSVFSVNAGLSKFLFAVNSTVSLKASWNNARYAQFINNELLPFYNKSLGVNIGIESKFFGKIALSYTGEGLWNRSELISANVKDLHFRNRAKRFDQNVSVGFSALRQLFLMLNGRYIFSSQANVSNVSYLFLDAKVRYRQLKWRTDFEFDLSNLTNIKKYELLSLSSNQFAVNRYDIRGRMGIVRATFNF
ncbi:carboxypeptidase-like regulatory domain-containing protein [Pedobacter sp. Du54]|uniref:carboxypeptidase-like regulatory domain-containing protein n=1 Tax=Pedobacter anseongensis TaxID=3133439 RepID=UPI00309C13AC